jgi:group I intron endonuclease
MSEKLLRMLLIDMQGIYKIINQDNNKYYVGSSNKMERRLLRHKRDLRGRRHTNPKLQNAWNFHGEKAFTFEVVEQLDGLTVAELRAVEDRYLLICKQNPDTNYNIFYQSGNVCSMSDERKKHLSEVMSNIPRNAEWRRKIGESNRRRGRLPEVSIQKMRDKLTGRKMPEELKQKLSLSSKGKPKQNSDFTVRTFYNYKSGEVVTMPTFDFVKKYNEPNIRSVISGKNAGMYSGWSLSSTYTGKVFSEQHRKKLSEMTRNRKRSPCSEETKRKISETNRLRREALIADTSARVSQTYPTRSGP